MNTIWFGILVGIGILLSPVVLLLAFIVLLFCLALSPGIIAAGITYYTTGQIWDSVIVGILAETALIFVGYLGKEKEKTPEVLYP